jgi:hypothetical protein
MISKADWYAFLGVVFVAFIVIDWQLYSIRRELKALREKVDKK